MKKIVYAAVLSALLAACSSTPETQNAAPVDDRSALSSGADESPSFAPNGRMILYESAQGGRGILAAVSSDGRVKQRLSSASGGDVREPAWGPLGK